MALALSSVVAQHAAFAARTLVARTPAHAERPTPPTPRPLRRLGPMNTGVGPGPECPLISAGGGCVSGDYQGEDFQRELLPYDAPPHHFPAGCTAQPASSARIAVLHVPKAAGVSLQTVRRQRTQALRHAQSRERWPMHDRTRCVARTDAAHEYGGDQLHPAARSRRGVPPREL